MSEKNIRKYALVTGGGRGIGRAIVSRLAHDGYNILVNWYSNREAAESAMAMVKETGREAYALQFDVSDPVSCRDAIGGWIENNPDAVIEVLVNNAGIRRDGLMFWMPEDDWYSVIRTNLDSFYNVTAPVLKGMLSRKYGRIINIASLSGLKGMPGQTNYSAAKGGLISATKALAQEVAKKKVTVNAVAPGFIRTDMTSDLDEKALSQTIPAGRFGEPEEVASLVSFLASPQASYITGETVSVNGGIF